MPSIEGVYAAALTPRRLGLQDVNLGVMWELVDFLCEHDVDGIVLFGATGEFVHYSAAERMRTMGLAPKRSRVPVLINVSHSTLDGAVELAQAAMASGAAGVLLMPPHFYIYDQSAITEFYRQFAEQAAIRIPILLYNIPQFTNPVDCATASVLIREGVVQGVKDSSGDWEYLQDLISAGRDADVPVMVGADGLFARARRQGAHGIVSGIASAIPELVVALNRVASGNMDTEPLGRRMDEFITWMNRLPTPIAIREAASLRGLKLGPHAVPLSPELQRTADEFREWFNAWLAVVLDECRRT